MPKQKKDMDYKSPHMTAVKFEFRSSIITHCQAHFKSTFHFLRESKGFHFSPNIESPRKMLGVKWDIYIWT